MLVFDILPLICYNVLMQCRAVGFLGVVKKFLKKSTPALIGIALLTVGLFSLGQNAYADTEPVVMINGKVTYEHKTFSKSTNQAPKPATGEPATIPQGSYYYYASWTEEGEKVVAYIYAPSEIKVGSSVTIATFTYKTETNGKTKHTARGSPVQTTVTDKSPSESELSSERDLSCSAQIGGFGWLICPISEFFAKAVDYLLDIVSEFLVVSPLVTDTESPIFMVWQYARNMANVVFIIFLLIVVYSQITGLGISNYGIKKVLPKVIIAAVLVNLSYTICAIAVDVSNILGSSIQGVFTSIMDGVKSASSSAIADEITYGEIFAYVTGGAVLGGLGLVASGGLFGALILLIPVLFSALISVLAAFVTLAARQAIITVLIIIAPLAFVAYLLPNTEKLFGKWKDMLVKMLVLFPLFSLVFGASQLAGWAIISSAKSIITVILGLAVQVIPLFITPTLIKTAGSLMGQISDFVKKPLAPADKVVKNWGTERANIRRRQAAMKGQERGFHMPHTLVAGYMSRKKAFRDDKLKTLEKNVENMNATAVAEKKRNVMSAAGRLEQKGDRLQERREATEADMKNRIGEATKHTYGNGLVARYRKGQIQREDNLATQAFEDKTLAAQRAERIKKDGADHMSKLEQQAYFHPDGEIYKRVLEAGGSEQGANRIIANAMNAQDEADKRLLAETTVLLGKTTQNNEHSLIAAFEKGYREKDGFTMRAAMNLLVEKKGAYGVGLMEKSVQRMFTEPEFADANADNTINGIMASHLANSTIADTVRKKAGLLWQWGSQNAGKDAMGNYTPLNEDGTPKTLTAYEFSDPTAHLSDAKNLVDNVLTSPGDVIKQGTGTLRHLVQSGALSKDKARQELRVAGLDPTLADNDRGKLLLLGEAAELFDGALLARIRSGDEGAKQEAERIVIQHMNDQRDRSGS